LLSKLPSKLSTIFTANEEDLRPTSLKPRSTVLSPGEWSKLILTRVLAQTIYDNDNALATSDKVENSLVGSVLLLDDPTALLSEVEEGKLLRDIRQTGAATVLTSNKWATGRFADHICVVKDGAIVEMGSHNDLISRGPQQSLYASKWHAMTMQ
jgi:ABC-type hemin transport system ATPase subunit